MFLVDAQRFRGLGLATATTSAAFFPHLEHRIRGSSSPSVTFRPTKARESFRLDVMHRTAVADHAH